MKVFISYSSADEIYAVQLERALSANGIDSWFAPKSINGGQDFAACIGKELSPHHSEDEDDRIEEDLGHLKSAPIFILLLSANSMRSRWVKKELKAAFKRDIPMRILKLDHSPLEESFEFMLSDVQVTDAYHLPLKVLEKLIDELKELSGIETSQIFKNKQRYTYEKVGIFPIASGDPYFSEGETLLITLGNGRFFLAPPMELRTDPANEAYFTRHHFAERDEVFASTLERVCRAIPVDGLLGMIEKSRQKIFLQFLNQENGCYFNNKKYGISHISGFERTENMAEQPILRIEMFLTDYFTHRVMKDVCKQLAKANRNFFRMLDFHRIGDARILLTSLGVNLLLADGGSHVILTSRSTNSAETYNRHNYSLSVIEGVSLSDYDTFKRTVNVRYAVIRGLHEELGVDEALVRMDTLKFYDLFVNPMNLEIGLSCSIELKQDLSLERDVLPLHGKDEQLEVAEKRILSIEEMVPFVNYNFNALIPQAVYTICVYLESLGVFMLDRMHRNLLKDSTSVIAKDGNAGLCGDTYVWGEHYIAVIDGATPKGELLWDGQRGDVYVAHLVADTIAAMNPEYTAVEAIKTINKAVHDTYAAHGVDFDTLLPEERLQCSMLIYSVHRHEVWSFGDCVLRINQRDFRFQKEGDILFAALRAFCIQIEQDRREMSPKQESVQSDYRTSPKEQGLSQYGREKILPYLKEYVSLANRNVPFGYDVIDGGRIHPDHVKVYAVQKDDFVVMASDGYPKLFDTLEETEEYLKQALKEDPTCIGILRGTKGVDPGNISYDDRTYVSFRVV